jgi:hypothetical protein
VSSHIATRASISIDWLVNIRSKTEVRSELQESSKEQLITKIHESTCSDMICDTDLDAEPGHKAAA